MKKKFFTLFLMVCGFFSLNAQESVTVPEAGQNYSIVLRNGGLTFTRASGVAEPKIKAASGDYDQAFLFEAVAGETGTYYIKNAYDNEYLVRMSGTNAWTMGWTLDPNSLDGFASLSDAKYQIVALADNPAYVNIKNLGSGSYLGTDNIEDGSTVYANKAATSDKSQWTIKVFSSEVDKSALIAKVEEANALYNRTTAGSGSDQYPAAVRTALKAKIDAAQAAIDDDDATQTDVNDALLDLTEDYLTYIDSVNPLQPSTSDIYYIINACVDANDAKLYLSDAAQVVNPTYAPGQQFEFAAVAGKEATYNIRSMGSELYMTRGSDGWHYTFEADPAIDLAQFQMKNTGTSADPNAQLYRIWNIVSGEAVGGKSAADSYAGIDEKENGRPVFADKSGKDIRHHWYIERQTSVITEGLRNALAGATDFLIYAVKGSGPDQYPAAEYDALLAAKASAEAVLANSGSTQSDVNNASNALTAALNDCIAAVYPYVPALGVDYNIIHSSGFFFGEYTNEEAAEIPAIFERTGEADQRFIFSSVPGYPTYFNITIASLGQYLTRDGEPENDYKLFWGNTPDDEYAQYEIKRAGNKDYYTIRCVKEGPDRPNSYMGTDSNENHAKVWIDKNGKDGKHYWHVVKESETGILQTIVNKAVVYSNNRELVIGQLRGLNTVAIYDLTGRTIATANIQNTAFTKTLEKGGYIVVVNGETPYRGVVIVK